MLPGEMLRELRGERAEVGLGQRDAGEEVRGDALEPQGQGRWLYDIHHGSRLGHLYIVLPHVVM